MPLLKKGVKTLGFKNGIKYCRICRTRKKYRTGSKITKSTGQNLLQKAMDIFFRLGVCDNRGMHSLEMPVPSQGHYGVHTFPVVD